MSGLQLVAENPFRVLGVYANSPKKEIVANKGKAMAFLKVGKSVEYPLDLNGLLPPLVRTIEMFNEAEAHLVVVREQIQYAQLWFLKKTPIDEVAFNHLFAGDMAKAKEIWSKQENLSSLQNKMVCYLIEGKVKYALTTAEKLYAKYGNEYVNEIDVHSNLHMTGTDLLYQMIDTLGKYVSLFKMMEYDLSNELKTYIGSKTIEPIIDKISEKIDKAQRVDRSNASARLIAAKSLVSETKEPFAQLKTILDKDDPQYQIIADKLGLAILQCGIDYYNNSNDDDAPHRAMEIQKYAQLIVIGDLAKQRCNENVKILQKIIDNLPPHNVLAEDRAIKTALEKYSDQPDEISYAITLLSTTKPQVQKIREKLGEKNAYYMKMSTLVVKAALHNVIEEVNAVQSDTVVLLNSHINTLKSTFREAWNAIKLMDEFDLEPDYKLHYNKNRATMESLCEQIGITTSSRIFSRIFISNSSSTSSSTNSRSTSSENRVVSYSSSSSISSSNSKSSSDDDYITASVVIVEVIWLIIGIANGDSSYPWWGIFIGGGVGLWIVPLNIIPMSIINWVLKKINE